MVARPRAPWLHPATRLLAQALSESDLQPVLYTPLQSIGTVTYHEVELEPGTYMAACFFPTAGTGAPHAMEGMVEVIKVS